MPRPKSNQALEVFSCRFPPGLSVRLTTHAQLHHISVRDLVTQVLLAHLDNTTVAPLEQRPEQVVHEAAQHIAKGLMMLGTVGQAPRRTSAARPVAPQPDGTPALDHAKFYLGKLCPGGHDWNGTGKTLKRKQGNKCMACENARKRERRGEQRAPSA